MRDCAVHAVRRGLLFAVTATATVTALLWDYFFTEPRYSFRITNPGDAMMFATYFGVALAMGHLAARLRAQQAAERRRGQAGEARHAGRQRERRAPALDPHHEVQARVRGTRSEPPGGAALLRLQLVLQRVEVLGS